VPAENLLVGLVCLALVPLIALRIWRGLRDGAMPLYKTRIGRDAGRAKFGALVLLHVVLLFVIAAIALDLLFNLEPGTYLPWS